MQPDEEHPPEEPAPQKAFSVVSILQFLGASSIVAITTWSLSGIIAFKNNQQQQLNTFIDVISEFMVQHNLDGPNSGKPFVPAVSKAAHGYALNTLSVLDGGTLFEDKPKKLALLQFLYDSELIGFCTDSTLGESRLKLATQCKDAKIQLKDAKLRRLDFPAIGLIKNGLDLSNTDLTASDFTAVSLKNSRFQRARLNNVDFTNSLLDYADLSSAYLIGAHLNNAQLYYSVLDNSQLCGADLRGAKGLGTASLKQVTFDEETKLPPGGKELLLANHGIYKKLNACRDTHIYGWPEKFGLMSSALTDRLVRAR